MLLTCLLEKAFGLNLILHKAKLTYQLGCDCIGVFRQINNLTNTPLWYARLIIQNKLSYEMNLAKLFRPFKTTQHYFLTEVLMFSYPLLFNRNGDPVPWKQWKSEVKKFPQKEKFENEECEKGGNCQEKKTGIDRDGKRFVNGLLKIQNIVFFTVDF